MRSQRNRLIKLLHGLAAAAPLLLHVPAQAAPGVPSSSPLFISASADPNIMFTLDNSGSMANIEPDTPFDASTTFANCPASITVNPSAVVIVIVQPDGDPYFWADGSYYDWGTTAGGTGITGRSNRCFESSATYTGRLYANAGSNGNTKYASGYGGVDYSGNYLNWYFGSSPQNWSTDARKRPSQEQRLVIAQNAAKKIVSSLNNVRVGLSSFDFDNGAKINVGIDDIANNRTTMTNEIDALQADSWTPLAEALHEVGRYFVGESNPQFDGSLTLHPGKSNQTTKDDDTVFNRSPDYDSGVSDASPIQYFCQQNFNVVLTDGKPARDRDLDSSTGLTDYDGDCASGNCLSYDRKPSQTYLPNGSDYWDDVAAALYDMDLRPDLDDFDGNAVKNNVRTYTIGFADPSIINDPLIQDTASNGNGLFLTASDPSQLQQAFEDATQDILAQVGSIAAVSFNTATLTSGSRVFQARFNTTRWSGELRAFELNADGSIGTEVWEAGSVLDGTAPSGRDVITNTDNNTAVPFTSSNLSSLSTMQQNDLNMGPSGSDGRASDRIAYLRGDDTNEGVASGDFRIRTSPLGDIVHSSPIFVGTPSQNYPNVSPFPSSVGDRYIDFKNAQKNRTEVLYVGANDGMLHAFRASDGRELMAFLPQEVFSDQSNDGLHHLTEQDYDHQYYVDLTPAIGDAYVPVVDGGTPAWHTVLVGGLRGGGKGLFALDVTDPSSFTENNADDIFMWEFTSSDDADLGLTFSQPTIARMNNGEWAAVFGNGYNNTGSGTAQLFILFLDGGLDGTWTQGTDYIKIDTGVGSVINNDCQDASSDCNGLSRPVLADVDGNGTVDRVYAGDLKGNMWAFDLSQSNDTNWGSAYSQGNTPRPLFEATDPGGNPQPITAQPTLAFHPTETSNPNIMVTFGTGQYMTNADKTDTQIQTFYGVWDSGSGQLTRGDLLEQQADQAWTSADIRVPTDDSISWNQDDGWFLDLPESGERVNTSAVILGEAVFFNTLVPDDRTCGYGGSGWLMAVDLNNGGEFDEPIFDVNNDGSIDDSDLRTHSGSTYVAGGERFDGGGMPGQSRFLSQHQYVPGTSGNVGERDVEVDLDLRTGRFSWTELFDD